MSALHRSAVHLLVCYWMDFKFQEFVAPPSAREAVTSTCEPDTDDTSEEDFEATACDGYEVLQQPLLDVKEEIAEEQMGSHSVLAVRPAKVERVHAAAAAAVPTGHAAPVSSFTAKIDAIVSAAEAHRGADACPAAAVEAPLMVPIQPAYPPPAHVVAAHDAASGESVAPPAGRPASVTVNISWDQVNDPLRGKVLDVQHAPITSPYEAGMLFSGYQVSKCNEFVSCVFYDPEQSWSTQTDEATWASL